MKTYKTYQKVLIIAALVLVAVPINIYVFMRLWAWFIVPTFHISPLTIAQALGLFVFIKWLTPSVNTRKSRGDFWKKSSFWMKAMKAIPATIAQGVIMLGIGYAIHFFI